MIRCLQLGEDVGEVDADSFTFKMQLDGRFYRVNLADTGKKESKLIQGSGSCATNGTSINFRTGLNARLTVVSK